MLRGLVVKSERIELDVSFSGSLPVDAEDNDAWSGLPELDWLGEVGPRLQVNILRTGNQVRSARFDLELPVRGVFSTDFSDYPEWRGVVFAPSIAYRNRNFGGSGLTFEVTAEAIFATEELMDYFYEVESRFVRPGCPAPASESPLCQLAADTPAISRAMSERRTPCRAPMSLSRAPAWGESCPFAIALATRRLVCC